jgi:CheY-like chemotaxis protein
MPHKNRGWRVMNLFIADNIIWIALILLLFFVALIYLIVQQEIDYRSAKGLKRRQKSKNTLQTQEQQTPPEQQTPVKNDAVEIPKKREFTQDNVPITQESFADFAGMQIIIADDNPINQKVITNLLAPWDIDILIADNGEEVLSLLHDNPKVSIIFMDAHMPVMDGFEAAKAIRLESKYNHLPIIALSGDTAPDDIRKMKEAGMQEHLEKPLRINKLYKAFYEYTDETSKMPAVSLSNTEQKQTHSQTEQNNGLNTQKGVEVCGGDKALYDDILQEFLTSYGNTDMVLQENLLQDNIDESIKLLLDISGLAANIGADSLAKSATSYREAIQNGQMPQYQGLQNEFRESFKTTIQAIHTLLTQ